MKRYELEAMNKEDLLEHAKVQGVELAPDEKKGTMIDKILGEYVAAPETKTSKTGIKMQKDSPDIPFGGRLYTLQGEPVDAPRYKVTIFATETDKSDVDIIVNGYNVRVKRGVEVTLMEPYVDVLRNAVVDTVVQDPDTGARISQRMMAYPHQAIRI